VFCLQTITSFPAGFVFPFRAFPWSLVIRLLQATFPPTCWRKLFSSQRSVFPRCFFPLCLLLTPFLVRFSFLTKRVPFPVAKGSISLFLAGEWDWPSLPWALGPCSVKMSPPCNSVVSRPFCIPRPFSFVFYPPPFRIQPLLAPCSALWIKNPAFASSFFCVTLFSFASFVSFYPGDGF